MTFLTPPKTVFFYTQDPGTNRGEYRVKLQGGTGLFRYNFAVPDDFKSLISAEVMMSVTAIVAGAGKDIDIYSNYHNPSTSDVYNENVESDTTTTYDLTGLTDTTYMLDISVVLSAISANSLVGIQVDNNAIGGNVYYFGIKLKYFGD